MLSMMLLASATARAGPVFQGVSQEYADLLASAWEAGIDCTGVVPEHHDVVTVTALGNAGGWGGRAHIDAHGLTGITLAGALDETPRSALLHEVGHAWFHGGQSALVEGFTQTLAACMAVHLGVPGRSTRSDLDQMPDLLTWSSPDVLVLLEDEVVGQAYRGSAGLAGSVVAILGLPRVARLAPLTWDELADLLEAEGTAARPVLELLGEDVEQQREKLADRDRDGLSELEEEILGTDPDRWDTDSDGWWDGEQPLPDAIPLPVSGQPVCVQRTEQEGVQVVVEHSTTESPRVGVRIGAWENRRVQSGVEYDVNEELEHALVWTQPTSPPRSGGAWIVGEPPPTDRCSSGPGALVEVIDDSLHGVDAGKVRQAIEAARTTLTCSPGWTLVRLGSSDTSRSGSELSISRRVIRRLQASARSTSQPGGVADQLASLVTAMQLALPDRGLHVANTHVEALWTATTGVALDPPLFAIDPEEVAERAQALRECRGSCPCYRGEVKDPRQAGP